MYVVLVGRPPVKNEGLWLLGLLCSANVFPHRRHHHVLPLGVCCLSVGRLPPRLWMRVCELGSSSKQFPYRVSHCWMNAAKGLGTHMGSRNGDVTLASYYWFVKGVRCCCAGPLLSSVHHSRARAAPQALEDVIFSEIHNWTNWSRVLSPTLVAPSCGPKFARQSRTPLTRPSLLVRVAVAVSVLLTRKCLVGLASTP